MATNPLLKCEPIQIAPHRIMFKFKTLLCRHGDNPNDPKKTIKIINPSVVADVNYGKLYINKFHPHIFASHSQIFDDVKFYEACMGNVQLPYQINSPQLLGTTYSYLTCWNNNAHWYSNQMATTNLAKNQTCKCRVCGFTLNKEYTRYNICLTHYIVRLLNKPGYYVYLEDLHNIDVANNLVRIINGRATYVGKITKEINNISVSA